MKDRFKAFLITKDESGQKAELTELGPNDLMEGDVVVAVSHSTVNYKDGLVLTGRSPVVRKFPMIPGIDFAGTVEASRHPEFRAGDKVVFWEASANRDETVFTRPFEFDVTRDPNPHLGFGHGVHHCLGANLARLEIRVVLDELCARVATVELAGPVVWTRSNKHTGIRHLPVRMTPKR